MERQAKYPRVLQARCSESELDQIKLDAELAGMSVSKYVRHRATSTRVNSKYDAKLYLMVKKIGGLLKKAYTNGHDTKEILAELNQTLKTIQSQGE